MPTPTSPIRLPQPEPETITGVIQAIAISLDTQRIALTLREDDGRQTMAVAHGERAIACRAVFCCGGRITLRGFDQPLAGGGLEFVITAVWTAH